MKKMKNSDLKNDNDVVQYFFFYVFIISFNFTDPYYYGDVAIIYAFSHEICLFLMVVDIIYAFSRDTYPYYYG